MKLLISGSRKAGTKANYLLLKEVIEKYVPNVKSILHGGAKGIDTLAQQYAEERDLETIVILPDYANHFPRVAPLLRNTELVKQCDWCIAFYDQTRKGGTLDAATKALAANKLLVEIVAGKVYVFDPEFKLT